MFSHSSIGVIGLDRATPVPARNQAILSIILNKGGEIYFVLRKNQGWPIKEPPLSAAKAGHTERPMRLRRHAEDTPDPAIEHNGNLCSIQVVAGNSTCTTSTIHWNHLVVRRRSNPILGAFEL